MRANWSRLSSNLYIQLLAALTLLAVIPLGVVGLGVATLHRQTLADQSARELTGIARAVAGELGVRVDGLLRDIEIISALPAITSMDPDRQDQVLAELFLHNDQFSALYVIGNDGQVLASSHPDRPPILVPEAFRVASEQGHQNWATTTDPDNDHRIMAIYAPIRNSERQITGVLAGVVNLIDLSVIVKKVQGNNGRAFVVDDTGRVLLHPEHEMMHEARTGPWLPAFEEKQLVGSGTTGYIRSERYIAGYAPLVDYSWLVLVERREADVVAPAQQSFYLTLAALVVTSGLAFLTALWLAGRLTRPIRNLVDAARAFAKGDSTAPLPPIETGEGDLDILITAFAEMRDEVASRETALRRMANRLESIHQIDQAILASQSPETVAAAALEHIQRLIPYQRSSVTRFVDFDRRVAVIVAAMDERETQLESGQQVAYERIDMNDALAQGRAFVVDDLATEQNKSRLEQKLEAEGIRSFLSLPLIVQGQLIGTLHIGSHNPYAFNEQHIEIAREAANSLAIALQQAELDKQIDRHAAELERRVQELQQAQAALAEERALLSQRVEERTSELSAANAQLARAARLKDEFLAAMSHELRTPLNAILGMAEILHERVYGDLTPEQMDSVAEISSSGRHLLDLITDILDLSKIEAGKMELRPGVIEIDYVCQSSLRMVKQVAQQKRLEVISTIDQAVSVIEGDQRRMKQILVNLLSNAAKFTPAGGRIGLEVTADEVKEAVHFAVWDTGIGIAREDMERLFQPFVQLDSRLSRRYEGTGLGLALVYRLVELHQGSVSVESEVGQGSRFTVSLPWVEPFGPPSGDDVDGVVRDPLTASVGAPAAQSGAEPVPTAKVLLAEDNEANINAITSYLQGHGYEVSISRNGLEAISRAREIEPDVILMDIQMPELDGLEATRRLRLESRFTATPIIALTALAMPDDRERCLAAGATEYLSKPVSLKNLLSMIKRYRTAVYEP